LVLTESARCKNAALFFENHTLPPGPKLNSSEEFYAFCEENLKQPDKSLIEKKGKGIYRRFFYYVPAEGVGAVNYKIARWEGIKGSNKIHQMRDVGEPGLVEARLRSCHCKPCYSERYEDCEYLEQMPKELLWEEHQFKMKAAGRRPGLRSDVESAGARLGLQVMPGDIVAFYVHHDEAWMLGKVLDPNEGAIAWGQPAAKLITGAQAAQKVQLFVPERAAEGLPQNWMGKLEIGDEVLYVQKFEAIGTRGSGRNEFLLTEKKFACFTTDLRVSKIK
jgi:hypothetical protein